jgi:hypothetical protein
MTVKTRKRRIESLFAAQYNTKYATSLCRRRRPDPRRWLALFLLSCLFLFCTLDPIGTFSRYFISFGNGFSLHTSSFYFKPSLTDPNGESFPANFQFKCNAEGFTESFKLMVANSIEGEVTDGDISYSITLNEAGANPLFDLYVDEGEGGKTPCGNNVINSTLEGNWEGDLENSNSHILCFKLKEGAEMPESGSIDLNLVVASSAPYAQSYTFKLSVKAGIGMILIPGTDIERPDVTIEAGEILVFKGEKYAFIEDVDDLMVPYLKIEDLMEDEDLKSGSLYVPASVGTLVVGSNKYINWDVYGHIILEPDILVNAWKPVNMVSHAGDVILNNTTIAGNTQPYQVNITAETGNIEANGTTINSRSAESGIIKLAAQNDIILSESDIASQGNNGIKILSEEGTIDVSNAVINSTNGATAASVVIQTAGHINLDGAQVISNASTALPNPALLIESTNDGISAKSAILTSTNSGKLLKIAAQGLIELDHTPVSSGGPISISTLGDISADSATLTAASNGGLLELLAEGFIKLDQATLSSGGNINIQTPGDISAKSANIFNNSDASYGHSINIYSINGAIDLSTLEVAGIPQTVVNSPPGNINIKAKQDIWCISSSITASSNYSGMVLRFESTGQGSKLYVDNATLSGHSIKAYGLQIEGTPASGNIQQL